MPLVWPRSPSKRQRSDDARRSRGATVYTANPLPSSSKDEASGLRVSACPKGVARISSRRLLGLPACNDRRVPGCRKNRVGGRMQSARSGSCKLKPACSKVKPASPRAGQTHRRRLGGSAARRLGGSAARRLGGSAARRLGCDYTQRFRPVCQAFIRVRTVLAASDTNARQCRVRHCHRPGGCPPCAGRPQQVHNFSRVARKNNLYTNMHDPMPVRCLRETRRECKTQRVFIHDILGHLMARERGHTPPFHRGDT